MDRLLYFPLASPPDDVALVAALYWETLCTMAPPGYRFESPLLEALAGDGAVQALIVDDYLSERSQVEAIVADVYRALDKLSDHDLEPDKRLPVDASTRLYFGKLPLVVQNELLELGVVTPSGTVLQASPSVLSVVLSVTSRFLAPALDAEDGRQTAIYTDRRRLVRQAVGGLGKTRTRAWQIQVGPALPVPAADTEPSQVISFRHRYRDERLEFSDAMTALAASLSIGNDLDVSALIRRLQRAESDVTKAGKAHRLNLVKRGLSLVGALGIATGAGFVGGPPELMGLAAALSGLGINYTTTSVRDESTPLAYLAEVRKHFDVDLGD